MEDAQRNALMDEGLQGWRKGDKIDRGIREGGSERGGGEREVEEGERWRREREKWRREREGWRRERGVEEGVREVEEGEREMEEGEREVEEGEISRGEIMGENERLRELEEEKNGRGREGDGRSGWCHRFGSIQNDADPGGSCDSAARGHKSFSK